MNFSKTKDIFKKDIEISSEKYIDDKTRNSTLYKKLLLEYQNLKKDFENQIQQLHNEIEDFDEQIENEKSSILSLTQKKNKMDNEINKYTQQLIDLQEKNYQLYWDVAARLHEEGEQYE